MYEIEDVILEREFRQGWERQPGEVEAYAGVERGGDRRKPPQPHLRWPERTGYSGQPVKAAS